MYLGFLAANLGEKSLKRLRHPRPKAAKYGMYAMASTAYVFGLPVHV